MGLLADDPLFPSDPFWTPSRALAVLVAAPDALMGYALDKTGNHWGILLMGLSIVFLAMVWFAGPTSWVSSITKVWAGRVAEPPSLMRAAGRIGLVAILLIEIATFGVRFLSRG